MQVSKKMSLISCFNMHFNIFSKSSPYFFFLNQVIILFMSSNLMPKTLCFMQTLYIQLILLPQMYIAAMTLCHVTLPVRDVTFFSLKNVLIKQTPNYNNSLVFFFHFCYLFKSFIVGNRDTGIIQYRKRLTLLPLPEVDESAISNEFVR